MLIAVLWIIAANDRGTKDDDDAAKRYKCRGCVWYHHDHLSHHGSNFFKWQKAFQDPYPILISFACILFVFWLLTGFVGIMAKNKFMAKIVSIFVFTLVSTSVSVPFHISFLWSSSQSLWTSLSSFGPQPQRPAWCTARLATTGLLFTRRTATKSSGALHSLSSSLAYTKWSHRS